MNDISVTLDASHATAPNVCANCRGQKRKCDKRLPSCSRCTKQKLACDYTRQIEEPQFTPGNSLSDFLIFHVPVTGNQQWLPGSFQPLQPYKQNIHSRGLDIDHFFVGLVMTALAEQRESLDRVLDRYFGSVHAWLPIIHEYSFRARLAQLNRTPRADTALLFLAVWFIIRSGCQKMIMHGDDHIQPYHLCRYLFSFLQVVREPSLEVVQAGLLLAVYELGSGSYQAASLSIGTCARLGYCLRLNVDDPQDQEGYSWVQREEERRTWLGIYMFDRLVFQAVPSFIAPHAVDDPPIHYRLPVDDVVWEGDPAMPRHGFFQPSFLTPTDIFLCYFAREIQGIRILGHVQALQSLTDVETFQSRFDEIDRTVIRFMEKLFEQTPRGWEVMCGANATVLVASITLHRTRLGYSSQGISPCHQDMSSHERSLLALRSMLNIVHDICLKFNALGDGKLAWVPLPAVVCTGEAILTALWMNKLVGEESRVRCEPFKCLLTYASQKWHLAADYLSRLESV